MPRASYFVGAYTAAKLDFLGAARGDDEPRKVGVNRRHCRPLHPYGLRMIKDGLMTLGRQGTKSSKHSFLTITQAGLAELSRLEKKQQARERKRAQSGEPPRKPKLFPKANRFAAINWLKSVPRT